MARLSVHWGTALIVVAAALFVASPAQAAPPTPVLTGTTPTSSAASPASGAGSLTPLIVGKGEETVVTSVVTAQWSAGGSPVGRALEPSEFEIQIFADATCSGSPVATGSVGTLESPGIQVTVAEAPETTFSALEINPEEVEAERESSCSSPLTYWQGTTPFEEPSEGPGTEGASEEGSGTPPSESGSSGSPSSSPTSGSPSPSSSPAPAGVAPATPAGPPSAPRLHTVPGGWANDTTPLVAGSAPGAATVKIYTTAGCAGSPVATGSAGQLAAGIPVQVVRNVVVAFYGISVGPTGMQSGCSAPTYYGEDSRRPHVRITMAPAGKTRRHRAVIRFTDTTGDTPGTVFRCKVNRRKWRRCSSPLRLKHLKRRHRYVVKIKARDPAGNRSRRPARRRFKVI